MVKNLKNIVVDMAQHMPILKMNQAKDYQHFLKDNDRKNVRALFYYCLDNRLELYLTGGVVSSGMMNGQRQYSDIDLLAVADSKAIYNLAMLLSGCQEDFYKYDVLTNMHMPKTLKEISQTKGSYVFNANGQLFQTIGASTAEKMYLNREVEERFILMPLVPVSNIRELRGRNDRPSAIDLSVVDRNKFQRCEPSYSGYV